MTTARFSPGLCGRCLSCFHLGGTRYGANPGRVVKVSYSRGPFNGIICKVAQYSFLTWHAGCHAFVMIISQGVWTALGTEFARFVKSAGFASIRAGLPVLAKTAGGRVQLWMAGRGRFCRPSPDRTG